ncbi:RadC family protein [uncultured Sphingomonas sp.]|uniref:JAB domain-containing protein n=1 Tax=uncultured Sphingomonas sp. TaxID=158754 RepID=UPI0025DF1022|nr:DNA repair protein RadC [uncultured Sphingomonas sp.]
MGVSNSLGAASGNLSPPDADAVAALAAVVGCGHAATRLIETYGSLGGVFSVPSWRLAAFIGVPVAKALAAHAALMTAALKERVSDRQSIHDWKTLADYLRCVIGHSTVEHFRVLYMDSGNKLIADETLAVGTYDSVEVFPREVLSKALLCGAAAIVLAHNHPSGNAEPSIADVRMTRRIMALAKELNIDVHDHIIVTRQGQSSLRTLGLMRP